MVIKSYLCQSWPLFRSGLWFQTTPHQSILPSLFVHFLFALNRPNKRTNERKYKTNWGREHRERRRKCSSSWLNASFPCSLGIRHPQSKSCRCTTVSQIDHLRLQSQDQNTRFGLKEKVGPLRIYLDYGAHVSPFPH